MLTATFWQLYLPVVLILALGAGLAVGVASAVISDIQRAYRRWRGRRAYRAAWRQEQIDRQIVEATVAEAREVRRRRAALEALATATDKTSRRLH